MYSTQKKCSSWNNFFSLLLLIALSLFYTSCVAQRGSQDPFLTSISIVDRNGLTETSTNKERLKRYAQVDFLSEQPYSTVRRDFSRDRRGNKCSVLTSYHENGQVKEFLEVVNNRALGIYREWWQDGSLKIEGRVIGGPADLSPSSKKEWLFDGLTRAWTDDEHLEAEILYQKGKLHGESLYYHTNGSLWKLVPFERGLLHGTLHIYLQDGTPLTEIPYRRGKRQGRAYRFWSDGSIAAQEDYQNDRLDDGVYYSREGREIARVEDGDGTRALFGKDTVVELQEYREGFQEGEVKNFEQQQVVRKYFMHEGKKHGEEKEFYLNGSPSSQPKLQISWSEGKIQGVVRSWYPSGKLESQREYSANLKHGISTAWYEDGSLMLIEEYENDRLVRGEYRKRSQQAPVSRVSDGNGVATLFYSDGTFHQKINYERGIPCPS